MNLPDITNTQAEAMDETMAYEAGQQAQAFADEHAGLLCPPCTGNCQQSDTCPNRNAAAREKMLQRRIATRQGLLATAPMMEATRRHLEDENEKDFQELAFIEAKRQDANSAGHDFGWLVWLLIAIFGIVIGVAASAANPGAWFGG